jgi:hypothetical protein
VLESIRLARRSGGRKMNQHPTNENAPGVQAEGIAKISNDANFKRNLCEYEVRLCRELLARPQASRKELEPFVSTYICNQIKSLRDDFGFEICMSRFKYNPLKPSKWYGVFSFTKGDRVKASQLLEDQKCSV